MILGSHDVVQSVTGDDPQHFVKDILRVPGSVPIGMVRKRLPPADAPPLGYHAAVLLTHGFGQNRYTWHLPGRSFVNHLARAGFDVFNLEFRGHGRSRTMGTRAAANADAYIHEDLPAALAEVLRISARPRAFLVGHSLGGLVAYASAPALRESLLGVVTLGAPYAFGQGNPVLLALTRALGFVLPRALGHAPLPMTLVQQMFSAGRGLWNSPLLPSPIRAWAPGRFEAHILDEYLRLAFDVATLGELLQTVASGSLGRWASADGSINYARAWEALDLPILVIAGSLDLLAPVASVRPAFDRSVSTDRSLQVFRLGHADLILGRDAPRSTWPAISAWLHHRAIYSSARAPGGSVAAS